MGVHCGSASPLSLRGCSPDLNTAIHSPPCGRNDFLLPSPSPGLPRTPNILGNGPKVPSSLPLLAWVAIYPGTCLAGGDSCVQLAVCGASGSPVVLTSCLKHSERLPRSAHTHCQGYLSCLCQLDITFFYHFTQSVITVHGTCVDCVIWQILRSVCPKIKVMGTPSPCSFTPLSPPPLTTYPQAATIGSSLQSSGFTQKEPDSTCLLLPGCLHSA